MVSCFGKRSKSPDKPLLSGINVYPPPIRIQKSLVIPGFIREGRQLSRTLSLNLNVDDSISTSNSEYSLENQFEKVLTKNDLLKEDLSFKNYYQYSDLDYDKHQNSDTENESNSDIKHEKLNSSNLNNYSQNPRNITERFSDSLIVNPVNIKPREIKKLNTNQTEVTLSNRFIKPTNSSNESNKVVKTFDNNFKDLHLNDYSGSNDYIDKYVTKEKNMNKNLVNDLENNNNILGGRRRILSAPNESIIHTEKSTNEMMESKQVIKNNKNRHRSPSLKILAQSVINLINKRGSKGLNEKEEVKSINKMFKDIEIQSLNSSEATLSRSPNSTVSSNSSFITYQNSNSMNKLIKKSSSLKKQVSFEMDLKSIDKKRSSKVSKKFTNFFGGRKLSKSNSKVEFNKKLSDPKINYFNNDDNTDYNSNTKNIVFSEDETFKVNHGELKQIEELNIPITTLTRSVSSETLKSNFSLDQRVARTYDMQILTYDQTPIPIPNLPRGRRLQSLENLENCYLAISPSILSLCYCR